MDYIKTGERIAFLRKQKGLTQEDLAEKLGVSPQAISKWENGHTMPETPMLPRLSRLLDSSIDGILMPMAIRNIEEIVNIDIEEARKILSKLDKETIAKALKGVSPATGEYLINIFQDEDLRNSLPGPIKISDLKNAHKEILDLLNNKNQKNGVNSSQHIHPKV